MINVFIVDDHPLVVEGLKSLLYGIDDIQVVATAANAFEAFEILQKVNIDIAFLDINLPDVNGIELCKKIKGKWPNIKCIALTTSNERTLIGRMMQNGAVGYLMKSSSKDELIRAIRQVYEGGYFMNVTMSETVVDKSLTVPFLTRREKEVLGLIADGMTNVEIADKLFVSPTTIKTHRENLLMKFGVSNTASLIKVAAQQGLLEE
jgi:DNA-binding NarL/FixJ family response regulator